MTQPDKDSVERLADWLDGAGHNQVATMLRALQARVDALTAERDAALANSGAAAAEMKAVIAKLRVDPSSSVMREAYWSNTWEACLDAVYDAIPTNAQAALDRALDGAFNEGIEAAYCLSSYDCTGDPCGKFDTPVFVKLDNIRALKRQPGEAK